MVWRLLAMFLAVAGLGGMLSCSRASEEKPVVLRIISPHGHDIRREFEDAFSKWHQAKYGQAVRVEWPDVGGGTSTILKYLGTRYDAAKENKTTPTSGIDLMWGGGSATFDKAAGLGYFQEVDPPVPEAVLKEIPDKVQGRPLRGEHNLWYGATMSYFGIVVNKDRLRELNLERPKSWKTLTGPEWCGEIALADPSKSGSVKTCYEMMLQQYGWEDGWYTLTRVFANSAMIKEGGSQPSEEAGQGNVTAGVVIDFYGRMSITKQGASVAEFIVPEGGSAIDPDPIAMLKGAPNQEVAAHMIEFVLSREGQRLWTHRPGVPGSPGGPARKALGRMAVIPALYKEEGRYMTDPTSPFDAERLLTITPAMGKMQALRNDFLGDLIKAAFIDSHAELTAARRAVKAKGDPPELMKMFDVLPFTEAEMKDIAKAWKEGNEPKPTPATASQSASAPATTQATTTHGARMRQHDEKMVIPIGPREQVQKELRDLWATRYRTQWRKIREAAEKS